MTGGIPGLPGAIACEGCISGFRVVDHVRASDGDLADLDPHVCHLYNWVVRRGASSSPSSQWTPMFTLGRACRFLRLPSL